MLVESQRYPVMMSATLYHWLIYRVLRPVLDAGPGAWKHGGRVGFGRLETLYDRTRQVTIQQNGRIVRIALKDARTLMGLLELHGSLGFVSPPRSASTLKKRLAWQVGDVDQRPGELPVLARSLRLIPIGRGRYLTPGPLTAGDIP